VGRSIRAGIERGEILTEIRILQQGERLGSIAGQVYGDSRLWWVIAAASDVGWGLQVPPGTRLVVPTDLAQVAELVG